MNETKKIEQGVVLRSSWGYDQTNIDFYKVTKVQNGWAWIQSMGQIWVSNEGWMAETVVPGEVIEGKPVRRKIKNFMGEDCIGINSYQVASIWDGKPELQTHTH